MAEHRTFNPLVVGSNPTRLTPLHIRDPIVIWGNGRAHQGDAMRTYLETQNLCPRLIALPPDSPDYNPMDGIWKLAREDATAITCVETTASVALLDTRTWEVQGHRCSLLRTTAFLETSRHPERRLLRLEQRRTRARKAAVPMQISSGGRLSYIGEGDTASCLGRLTSLSASWPCPVGKLPSMRGAYTVKYGHSHTTSQQTFAEPLDFFAVELE